MCFSVIEAQCEVELKKQMKTDDEDLVDVRGSGLRHLGTIKIEVQQGVIDYEYRNPHRRVGAREPRGQAATVGYVRETDHK